MNKDMTVQDAMALHDEVHVADKFDLEPLIAELALESLRRAEEATELQTRADDTGKRSGEVQAMKYCAATMVFAQILVESYFNWILQHRMVTHHDVLRNRLGQIIANIRSPVSERWLSLIEAIGFLVTGRWVAVSVETRSDAQKLSKWRNHIVHYKAEPIPVEKLPRTPEGVVIGETEQQLTIDNAKEAIGIARHMITELHRAENTEPSEWTSLLTAVPP